MDYRFTFKLWLEHFQIICDSYQIAHYKVYRLVEIYWCLNWTVADPVTKANKIWIKVRVSLSV